MDPLGGCSPASPTLGLSPAPPLLGHGQVAPVPETSDTGRTGRQETCGGQWGCHPTSLLRVVLPRYGAESWATVRPGPSLESAGICPWSPPRLSAECAAQGKGFTRLPRKFPTTARRTWLPGRLHRTALGTRGGLPGSTEGAPGRPWGTAGSQLSLQTGGRKQPPQAGSGTPPTPSSPPGVWVRVVVKPAPGALVQQDDVSLKGRPGG